MTAEVMILMNTPQEKITEARQRGDLYEQNVLGGELQKLMKDKNVSPIKAIYPILMQASEWTSPPYLSCLKSLLGNLTF